jgi:YesN/AraC family two-component response regulator
MPVSAAGAGPVTIRILLVDDERLLRTGFSMILRSEPDLTVVGEAADGQEAVTAAAELNPDLILMDIRMPGLDGLAPARFSPPEARHASWC